MAFDNFTIVCWPLICAAIDMYEPHLTWTPTFKRQHYQCCRDLSKCEEERQKIVLDTRNKYVYCRSPWNRSTQNTLKVLNLELLSLAAEKIQVSDSIAWVLCFIISFSGNATFQVFNQLETLLHSSINRSWHAVDCIFSNLSKIKM